MVTLFKALVLPHLEYCCQLWNPAAVGQVRKLECIQRNFTRRIQGMDGLDYWKRLAIMKLYSVQRRRERYLLIYVYKIICGLVPNITSDRFSIRTYQNSHRLGRFCKIPPINTGETAGMKTLVDMSFAVHAPKLFNGLPKTIREFDGSVDSFKNRLDGFLSQIPDEPSLTNYPQVSAGNSILQQKERLRREGIFL